MKLAAVGAAGRAEVRAEPSEEATVGLPSLDELEAVYSALTPEERDELLQELLTAAPHGGEALVAVLEAWLLDRAVRGTIDGL